MVRRDNAPDRNFCAEKWYDDKSLAYVPQATALNDEAFVAPSFLTLKLIREMKKKYIFFPLVFDPVGCLFKFNHYQYFYLFMNSR